jgi:MoaA/NifB/PqqE/SkfB family radical SAM enzyme
VICRAPLVSLDFDPRGNVQVCCANSIYPIGNVVESTIRDIWEGGRARALRAAVAADDLSMGCMVCRHRIEHAGGEVPRDYYDDFTPDPTADLWPQLLSFSMHNTCNLECIMCGPDLSSKIRSRRAGLAPLPHVYDDRFFDELEPFLAHCVAVDMAGGEPFLVREHQRIWSMLEALDHRPKVSVTTNGTVWNDQVERVLDRFDTNICVSIDGTTRETFESIRTGASHAVVFENLERFRAYAESRGTGVFLSFSLIRHNWFELGSVLEFAEERDMGVSVQTVHETEFGVQHLPTAELQQVVDGLTAEDARLGGVLNRNLGVWNTQLDRLRVELAERGSPERRARIAVPPSPEGPTDIERSIVEWAASATTTRGTVPASLVAWSGGGSGTVTLDMAGRVIASDLEAALPASIQADGFDAAATDRPFADVLRALELTTGASMWIGEEVVDPARLEHLLWFSLTHGVRDRDGLSLRLVSIVDSDRVTVHAGVDAALWPGRDRQPVAVTIGSRVG